MGASFAVAPIRGSQKYYQTGSKLIPVWDVNVQLSNVWYVSFVLVVPVARRDAPSLIARAGQILDALYNVIPIGRNNPQSNNGLTKVRSPWNTNASPNGWHFTQNQQTFDLTGNNVFAQSNPNNIQDINQLVALPRPSSNSLTFDYPFDPTKDEKNANNRDAATTNMFYVANACHDIFYQYGFTEAAGNFQNENFGKGGSENDPVIANSQDGSGTNNANFATGPDGYAGLMRMYVFTPSGVPARDGALENDIIIHEMGHGLSTRLTGGAATANCLNSLISGGMGEGWSDFVGYTLSLPTAFTRNSDYAFGDWAAHGYRKPYSTSLTRNTMAYSNLASLNEVHAIGQVWAEFLWEALWNLIDQAGMTPAADLAISQDAGTGNTALLKIVIEGMKIQPCNPTFVSARDAILTAESKLYGGKFKCGLWTAFAKRGLGTKAVAGTYRDSFDLPAECSNQPPKTTTTTVAVVKTTTAPVVVKTTTTAAPVVTTTAVPVITTKKVVTTTKAGTTVTVGQPCTNFGQWACNNSVQCSYGASGSLEWIALVAGVQGC
ncbi:hypothetical protein BCR33DRAFT_679246 [Rhizoclosmatium globosum]|uniref:Extracellular metalloproteinase n=1 Tax=Rhizoclosmatium globosum TaxID=329046 RepID=A0A1Y2CCQ1_9FUNG|nr:hypothetical protein BCR33DRAFT_679246 [Rhizoclosmatium globosum]|eukprot:ORY44706.1 hypothetical protein BCR33DRAFT_679246 [Rhizoclosmatium globosum]